MRCVSTIVSNVEVSFHVGFIQEVARFGIELAFGWYHIYLKKHHRSAVDLARDRTRDARKTGVCCGLQKEAVSYVIPTLILSFHTIEYFVPFLGTKLFHFILNYQSHNNHALDPCRDGCLANTD